MPSHRFVLAPLAASLAMTLVWPAPSRAGEDWRFYGGDAGGMRWSPLAQIDRSNVSQLVEAWRIRTGDLDAVPPPPGHMAFQSTPILVDGLLVLPTPMGRVLALDPETGAERWRFDATVKTMEIPEFTARGVASWMDAEAAPAAACRRRIFATTVESRLFAIDAGTGRSCPDFGREGEVDLREGVGEVRQWEYTISSPPTLVGDLVIVGSAIADNRRVDMPKGIVRASGAQRECAGLGSDSSAQTIPPHAEWRSQQAARVGAANACRSFADPARAYRADFSTIPNIRRGAVGSNRYANSVVALRASTGRWVELPGVHQTLGLRRAGPAVLTGVLREARQVSVWCRPPRWVTSSCCIARPARRSFPSRSGRCRPPTCRESRPGRHSRFRPRRPPWSRIPSRRTMPGGSRPGIAAPAASASRGCATRASSRRRACAER